jgi:hypothetical protein
MDLFPLTDETKALIAQLREMMAAASGEHRVLLDHPSNVVQLQEDDLCRYLKARKLVVKDAFDQMIATLKWRAEAYEVGVDKMFADGVDPQGTTLMLFERKTKLLCCCALYLSFFPPEEFFQTNCPHCYRGFDKEGRPISWERTGVFQLPVLLEVKTCSSSVCLNVCLEGCGGGGSIEASCFSSRTYGSQNARKVD